LDKASLTEEEKKVIENDIFGQRAILEFTKMVARTCVLMHDAVDLIHRQSYIRALAQCLDLVQIESDPLRFTRCERYDAFVRIDAVDEKGQVALWSIYYIKLFRL
jgi:hypothetical protein